MAIDIILPASILLMSFLLKMSIDRSLTPPTFWNSIYELPVDTMFLSTSLIAAGAIKAQQTEIGTFFVVFVAYMMVSVITIIIWRKTVSSSEKKQNKTVVLLVAINYIFCALAIKKAVEIL